jgi:hypothetical protein
MKKTIIVTAVLFVLNINAPAQAQNFLQKLQKKLENSNATSSGGSSTASNSKIVGGQFCQQFFGKPFKQKQLNDLPEKIVGKYFKVTPETDKMLVDGVHAMHAGSLSSMRLHLDDLKDKVVRQLADAYLANPSIPMMAQVIAYSESGDGFTPENAPSELAEAQTLLAMMMMQYPSLTINNGYVNELLKQAQSRNSGLAKTFLARNYLFGDYAPQNINTFSNYIAQAQSNYPVKLADRSIFFALEKIPNWRYRQQYLDILKQSQEMQQSFQSQQQAARGSNLNGRALELMQQGNRADYLTLEALGAGPKIAEIKAKGEMLRKEAAGESNLIKVEVGASDDAKAEIIKMMATAPVLDDAAKAKLAEAIKIKADNLNRLHGIAFETAMKFWSGDFGATVETGQYINQYARNTCQLINRQAEIATQSGIPAPQLDTKTLSKNML